MLEPGQLVVVPTSPADRARAGPGATPMVGNQPDLSRRRPEPATSSAMIHAGRRDGCRGRTVGPPRSSTDGPPRPFASATPDPSVELRTADRSGSHAEKSGVQSRLSAGSAALTLCHMLPNSSYFTTSPEDVHVEALRHAAAHSRLARAVSNHTNGARKRTSWPGKC
jgi:hypothetical protein